MLLLLSEVEWALEDVMERMRKEDCTSTQRVIIGRSNKAESRTSGLTTCSCFRILHRSIR